MATIWAWGNNSSSELGDNTTINKDIPTQIGSDTDWLHILQLHIQVMLLK